MAGRRPTGIKAGSVILWKERYYRVVQIEGGLSIVVIEIDETESVVSSNTQILTMSELFSPELKPDEAPIFGKDVLQLLEERIKRKKDAEKPAVISEGLSDSHKIRAQKIIERVEFVQKAIEDSNKVARSKGEKLPPLGPIIKSACALLGMTDKRYYQIKKIYDECDGLFEQIAYALRRKDKGRVRVERAVLSFVDAVCISFSMSTSSLWEMLKLHYDRCKGYWVDIELWDEAPKDLIVELLDARVPFDAIFHNPEKRKYLTKEPIKLPGRTWFFEHHRWFQRFTDAGEKYIRQQLGDDVWDRICMVFDQFVHKASMPLQFVFADHCLIDVFTVNEEDREQTHRLWLTVLIDAFTRCPIGYSLSHGAPSIESIQSALQNTIWPKVDEDWGPDLSSKWPCFGIPSILFLDNALAHHSHSLKQLARKLTLNGRYNTFSVDFRRPYKARLGALIERFFGSISRRLKEGLAEAGAILAKVSKHILSPRKLACLLTKDIHKVIRNIFIDYINREHSELERETPLRRWLSGIEQTGIPIVPPKTDIVERFFWREAKASRKINDDGINWFGMTYYSHALGNHFRSHNHRKDMEYHVSYDVENIGTMAVWHDGRYICDAYSKKLMLANNEILTVSITDMEIAKEIARSKGYSTSSRTLFATTELKDIIDQRQQQRQAQSRASKSGNKPSGGVDRSIDV